MADENTDTWTFEVLAPDLRREMATLQSRIQWTDLMYVLNSDDGPQKTNIYQCSTAP
jgi:hypothetical protein